MALTLPFPGQPAANSALASNPVLANINALAQAIQSFDASQVAAGTLTAPAFAASINPNTLMHDTFSPFVQSGCVWTTVSGLAGTMSAGVIYAENSTSMFRTVINSVGSFTFTASKDTYIDIDYNGNITYSAVANGAAAPALTANSLRVAKVVTNGSAITSITQNSVDSNNVRIYPNTSVSLNNKSTDANGWERYDYGSWQEYRKQGSFSQTVAANAWVGSVGAVNLPVGLSTLGSNFVECAIGCSDPAGFAELMNFVSASTGFAFQVHNQYASGSINPTITWAITIITA